MQEAFRLGGWGMYPTLFVGAVLVICAARFAMNPARGRLPVVIGLGVLALLTSSLGFVTGVIKTALAAGQTRMADSALVTGVGESLVNVGFGLVLLVIACIATVIGLSRRSSSRDGRADLVDPHQA